MKLNLRIMLLAAVFYLPASIVTSYEAAANQKQATQKTSAKSAGKASSKVAQKKTPTNVKKKTAKRSTKAAPVNQESRFSALVVNADTGKVLYQKNAGATRYPASLTKMMTLYLTFDALKKGTLSMDDTMPVSEKAASQPQTNISLNPGDRLSVKTAIQSLVVRSANDASMVLAEHLGGSQWNFALMMTQKARALGMKNTIFRNPNGLPDNGQVTTAYDMAKLGIALRRDFPEYYHWFKISSFSYNGITYPSHNRVIARYDGADGIKTGYIRASGFNLVTSVKKDGYNIVAVIMGGSSASARDDAMINMLDRTFSQLEGKQKAISSDEETLNTDGEALVAAKSGENSLSY